MLKFPTFVIFKRYESDRDRKMMKRVFADTDQIDSAVTAEKTVHEPDRLEKLIKQNQDTLAMMGHLMKMLAGKAAYCLYRN